MTATQFEIDNALMAGLAYQSSRDKINWFPAPSGWIEFSHVPNSTYPTTLGFEASAFQNSATGHIVISYAGTNPTSLTDWIANLSLGAGFSSSQLEQAALYYLQVKQANPTATISFTGHSLGGGLAALMGVFFDEQAVTFDQAPFESSSSGAIRAELKDFLNSNGYSDALLTSLVPEFMSYSGSGTRTANVTGYYVEGEALQLLQPPLGVLGTQTPLSQSGTGLDILGIDLHSHELLTAFLLNEAFRDLSFKLPSLLQAMFDKGLYAENTATSEPNFLENLLRHQTGVAADPIAGIAAVPADAMLDRFVVDLQKLTPDTYGMASGTGMAEALVVAAMEYHYFKDAAGATQLFTFDSYGLHFKYSDIGVSSYKSLPKLVDSVNAYLTPEEKTLLNGRLVKQDAWHIQSGVGGMVVHAGAGNDAMIGGANSDGLWGGGGIDILIGGANNDVLAGEAGNDFLLGGIGFDTYIVNAGDGYDTVLDSDGLGVIQFGTVEAKGNASVTNAAKWIQRGNVWQDQEHGITYGLATQADGSQTLLVTDLNGSTVEIKGWSDGELGIDLGAGAPPAAAPVASLTLSGDLQAADQDSGASGIQEGYDDLGNLKVTDAADPDREDTLYDSVGNDHILGLGGSDYIYAHRGGDNLLEGGEGSDVVMSLGGNDHLFGKDQVADLAAYILTSEAQPGTGTRGDWLSAGDGTDTLVGDAGNDVLLGGENEDLLIGGGGNDTLYGDQSGYATRDWTATRSVQSSGGVITYSTDITNGTRIEAAIGAADVIYGGAGEDWIDGGQGNDIIDAGADNDVVFGGQGADVILGQGGNDVLIGNAGADKPQGDGADYIDGGAGNDQLWGGTGNDVLLGGADNDYLYGEAGDDRLDGGTGIDYLAGGDDNDTYLNVTGEDIVYDNRGDNTIQLAATSIGAAGLATSVQTSASGGQFMQLQIALDTGGILKLDDPFAATGSTALQFANGDELDLETLVGESLLTPLNLNLGDAGGRAYAGAGDDTLRGGAGADTLVGHNGGDTLYGNDGADTLDGGEGADTLSGGTGADALYGEAGGDYLDGGDGDDILDGGAGDDTLDGGAGNDTYLFGLGSGQDVIWGYDYAAGKQDTIRMGEGIAADDVILSRTGTDLVLNINGAPDRLTVQDWAYGASNQIERIEFADGTVWDTTYWQNLIADLLVVGTEGDDYLYGGEGNNILNGLGGSDTLDGGAGDDIFLLGSGSGQDEITDIEGRNRIEFAAEIDLESLMVTSGENDFQISYGDAGDSAYVPLEWAQTSNQFKFSDGSYVLSSELLAGLTRKQGDDSNNLLVGLSPGVSFAGGWGDDVLIGGAGDNVYHFNRDDGADAIVDLGGVDTLSFGEGITPDDVWVESGYLGDQLPSFRVYVGEWDSVSIQNGEAGSMENFRFYDGTNLSFAELLSSQGGLITAPVGSTWYRGGERLVVGTEEPDELDDTNVLFEDGSWPDQSNVAYLGGLGNDSISGNSTATWYLFNEGDGNDTIYRVNRPGIRGGHLV